MKTDNKIVELYDQCQKNGYLDMSDDTQRVKAKVIAKDLGLDYRHIEELLVEAEKQYKEQKALESKLAVKGDLQLTYHCFDKSVYLYKRPDGSFYCIPKVNGHNGERIEDCPKLSIKPVNVSTYNYHPSKTVFTGASVGGVATGGLHETEAHYTQKTVNTGKGIINFWLQGEEYSVKTIELSESIRKLYRRDPSIKRISSNGIIRCATEMDELHRQMYLNSQSAASIYKRVEAADMAAASTYLPMSECKNIVQEVNRIIAGKEIPASDEELYEQAIALESAGTSGSIRNAQRIYEQLLNPDFKDSRQRIETCKTKYQEAIQNEKEQLIIQEEERQRKKELEEEERKRKKEERRKKKSEPAYKRKRMIIISILLLGLLLCGIAAAVIWKVIIPSNQAKEAEGLIASGDYEGAYEQILKIDNKDKRAVLIEELNSKATMYLSGLKVGNGYEESYKWDDHGNITECRIAQDKNNRTIKIKHSYYDSGNLSKSVINDNTVVKYYDTESAAMTVLPEIMSDGFRIVDVANKELGFFGVKEIKNNGGTSKYDEHGNIEFDTSGEDVMTYKNEYDKHGNLVKRTRYKNGKKADVDKRKNTYDGTVLKSFVEKGVLDHYDGINYEIKENYDEKGRLIHHEYSDNDDEKQTCDYTYTADLLTKKKINDSGQKPYIVDIAYDAAENATGYSRDNGEGTKIPFFIEYIWIEKK